jgi:hypothetical protein
MPRGARQNELLLSRWMMTLALSQRKTKNASFRSSGKYNNRMETRVSWYQEEKNTGLIGHITKGTLLRDFVGKRTWPQIFINTFGIFDPSLTRGSRNPSVLLLWKQRGRK